MRIYVIRHAWAEAADVNRWPDDSVRPLTKEGRSRFRGIARRLVRLGIKPQFVASSPHLRCVETAEILLQVLPTHANLETTADLAPQGEFDRLVAWTQKQLSLHTGDVAWVGHAPDVSHILAQLVGGGRFQLGKGAVAGVEFEGTIVPGEGQLIFLFPPRMLEG